ncbi:hypothetical protein FISHEDRAFT_78581 [Fistulina hepatica ATCC 64428]|nr:hypothetical protein FISHEDRAFT_78581 [Fistulina hepatica ATCC 64428]
MGTCKFCKISAEEKAQQYQEWHAKITSGEIVDKLRRECSNKDSTKGPRVPIQVDDQGGDDSPDSSEHSNNNNNKHGNTSTSLSSFTGPPTTASSNKQCKTAGENPKCKTKVSAGSLTPSAGGANMILTLPDANGSSFHVF